MNLMTKTQYLKLIANGWEYQSNPDFSAVPVVKLFTPDANCTWLLTDLDPLNNDIANGLCDLGMGSPELGSVSISELLALRGKLGLPVERDKSFKTSSTIGELAKIARRNGRI